MGEEGSVSFDGVSLISDAAHPQIRVLVQSPAMTAQGQKRAANRGDRSSYVRFAFQS
jgi:hypothetical protein